MTKDEALKMAIEQLNIYKDSQEICAYNLGFEERWSVDSIDKAINACKEALEQPAFNRLTDEQVEEIIAKCVKPIDHGLHWDFKKMYEDLFEAITGEKHGS